MLNLKILILLQIPKPDTSLLNMGDVIEMPVCVNINKNSTKVRPKNAETAPLGNLSHHHCEVAQS